jgi:hypothetical protein
MPVDRYLRTVLTVIALCLVYLCLVLTPWPVAQAQQSGVFIVGWKDQRGHEHPLPVPAAADKPGGVAALPVSSTR